MNNSNCNSSIQFNISTTNPIEFSHISQPFPNLANSLRPANTNNNTVFRPDSNLIRPIPHKVDLSRMLYQQFLDPYPRLPPPALTDMNEVAPENYFAIQKMFRDTIPTNNVSQNNTNNGINDFSHQIRNSNFQFNDPRILIDQYLSSNAAANRSGLLTNQFYPNSANMKSQDIPVLSTANSYVFNNINHQALLRPNKMDGVAYVSMNGSSETLVKNGLREGINTINNVQYYPKSGATEEFVDNRYSMSLNQHLIFSYKGQDTLTTSSKLERSTKKPLKQQTKNTTAKTTKMLKRSRKSKILDNCVDPLLQNNLRENSLTTCATPSDSSISPVSMVSCRSTTTPQTCYPSFSNLIPTDKLTMYATEKSGANSIESENIPNSTRDACKKMKTDRKVIQGLPIKKRIKWQMEKDDEEYPTESWINDSQKRTTEEEREMKHTIVPATEADDKRMSTETSDSYIYNLEDPLKTFQKTFLPMEKHSNSSDTESDNDLVIADYNNI